MNIGEQQNNIANLPSLDLERYENIFRLYTTTNDNRDSYYFYNIANKVIIPEQLDKEIIAEIDVATPVPWTTLSYKIYGTQFLWWLIVLINKPQNIFYADSGISYKYIVPNAIPRIINSIQGQLG